MEGIVPEVRYSAKEQLEKGLRRCADGQQRIHYLIIVNLLNGRGATETACPTIAPGDSGPPPL